MFNSALTEILIITGIIFAALVFIGVVIARLYTRSSKEVSFVRTGFGGESDFKWWGNCPPCFT